MPPKWDNEKAEDTGGVLRDLSREFWTKCLKKSHGKIRVSLFTLENWNKNQLHMYLYMDIFILNTDIFKCQKPSSTYTLPRMPKN